MTSNSEISVLILEDEPIIAEDLHSLLESSNYKIAGLCHHGEEALDMLSNRAPSFAILDINLGGGMTGLDVAEVINAKYNIPYIFLTSFDDDKTLQEAQQHAPYGYIVKPFQDRTLLTTIKTALYNFDRSKQEESVSKESIESTFNCKVTKQEFKIIEQLLLGKSYQIISADLFISQNTLKYHVKNIYTKLDIKGRSELASKLF